MQCSVVETQPLACTAVVFNTNDTMRSPRSNNSSIRLKTHKQKDPSAQANAVTNPIKSSSKDTNKGWDRRIARLSCAAFCLGCVWILLFPLVTVTTGEAKPRGTFYDENAMLVHHTTVKLAARDVAWAQPRQLAEAHPQVTASKPLPLLLSSSLAFGWRWTWNFCLKRCTLKGSGTFRFFVLLFSYISTYSYGTKTPLLINIPQPLWKGGTRPC